MYDAHEYFTEIPELVERPAVKRAWEGIARFVIPRLKHCYTVCESLAELFETNYGTSFDVIRNVPFKNSVTPGFSINKTKSPKILLYQGALNDGRGLEEMLVAMSELHGAELWLAGEGDLSNELRQLAIEEGVGDKVNFLGYVLPADLKKLTHQAYIGLNLLQNKGLNYYYSLANKSFDYIQANIPSINMNFPEYQRIAAKHEVGLLIDNLNKETLVQAVSKLLNDKVLYESMIENCKKAALVYIWEEEEKKLLKIYKEVAAEVS